jgi:hypothetical protein
MARIILLNGPPVNTHFKKNLHAFKNLAASPGFSAPEASARARPATAAAGLQPGIAGFGHAGRGRRRRTPAETIRCSPCMAGYLQASALHQMQSFSSVWQQANKKVAMYLFVSR